MSRTLHKWLALVVGAQALAWIASGFYMVVVDFDFFWMLHTMDYRGRDDFNNPLVILFTTGALWLRISGALLLIRAFRPRSMNRYA